MHAAIDRANVYLRNITQRVFPIRKLKPDNLSLPSEATIRKSNSINRFDDDVLLVKYANESKPQLWPQTCVMTQIQRVSDEPPITE